jgi:hypothetical protein
MSARYRLPLYCRARVFLCPEMRRGLFIFRAPLRGGEDPAAAPTRNNESNNRHIVAIIFFEHEHEHEHECKHE